MGMTRHGIPIIAVLLAGCSTTAEMVLTPQQAMAIALSSECAAAPVHLMQGEVMATEWVAARAGDKWHVWLPPAPGSPDTTKGAWLKGAWINAADGQIDHCELRIAN
jgi:hypothetical protein